MRLFILLVLGWSLSVYASNPKEEAMQKLIEVYDVGEGRLENILALRKAMDDAIVSSVLSSLDIDSLPTLGGEGKLIIEFSDYQCGYCRHMFPLVNDAVNRGLAKVVIIELPILGALSETAAHYALLAQQQDKYEQFHRLIMQRSGRLSDDDLQSIAEKIELNTALLTQNDKVFENLLEQNYRVAVLLNLSGTPAFIIDGTLIRGAMEEKDFYQLLES